MTAMPTAEVRRASLDDSLPPVLTIGSPWKTPASCREGSTRPVHMPTSLPAGVLAKQDGRAPPGAGRPARLSRWRLEQVPGVFGVFCRADSTPSPSPSPEPDRKSSDGHRHQNVERRLADQVAKVTECVAVSASRPAKVVVSVGHGIRGVTGNLGVAGRHHPPHGRRRRQRHRPRHTGHRECHRQLVHPGR
jgi:hypothetical protein